MVAQVIEHALGPQLSDDELTIQSLVFEVTVAVEDNQDRPDVETEDEGQDENYGNPHSNRCSFGGVRCVRVKGEFRVVYALFLCHDSIRFRQQSAAGSQRDYASNDSDTQNDYVDDLEFEKASKTGDTRGKKGDKSGKESRDRVVYLFRNPRSTSLTKSIIDPRRAFFLCSFRLWTRLVDL